MSTTTIPITTYQTPDGKPVANGYLLINLSQPGVASSKQLQTNKVKVPLDGSGVIVGSPQFWPNADIAPTGTYYVLAAYDSKGQLVSGPNTLTI